MLVPHRTAILVPKPVVPSVATVGSMTPMSTFPCANAFQNMGGSLVVLLPSKFHDWPLEIPLALQIRKVFKALQSFFKKTKLLPDISEELLSPNTTP